MLTWPARDLLVAVQRGVLANFGGDALPARHEFIGVWVVADVPPRRNGLRHLLAGLCEQVTARF